MSDSRKRVSDDDEETETRELLSFPSSGVQQSPFSPAGHPFSSSFSSTSSAVTSSGRSLSSTFTGDGDYVGITGVSLDKYPWANPILFMLVQMRAESGSFLEAMRIRTHRLENITLEEYMSSGQEGSGIPPDAMVSPVSVPSSVGRKMGISPMVATSTSTSSTVPVGRGGKITDQMFDDESSFIGSADLYDPSSSVPKKSVLVKQTDEKKSEVVSFAEKFQENHRKLQIQIIEKKILVERAKLELIEEEIQNVQTHPEEYKNKRNFRNVFRDYVRNHELVLPILKVIGELEDELFASWRFSITKDIVKKKQGKELLKFSKKMRTFLVDTGLDSRGRLAIAIRDVLKQPDLSKHVSLFVQNCLRRPSHDEQSDMLSKTNAFVMELSDIVVGSNVEQLKSVYKESSEDDDADDDYSMETFIHNVVIEEIENVLYPQIFSECWEHLQRTTHAPFEDKVFSKKSRKYGAVSQAQLFIKDAFISTEVVPYVRAIALLRTMAFSQSPTQMLRAILSASEAVFMNMKDISPEQSSGVCADEFLPVMIYVVLKANVWRMMSHMNFIKAFACDSFLQGEMGYYFSSAELACEYIKELTDEKLAVDTSIVSRTRIVSPESARMSRWGRLDSHLEVVYEERLLKGFNAFVIEEWYWNPSKAFSLVCERSNNLEDTVSVCVLRVKENASPAQRQFVERAFLQPAALFPLLRVETTLLGSMVVIEPEQVGKKEERHEITKEEIQAEVTKESDKKTEKEDLEEKEEKDHVPAEANTSEKGEGDKTDQKQDPKKNPSLFLQNMQNPSVLHFHPIVGGDFSKVSKTLNVVFALRKMNLPVFVEGEYARSSDGKILEEEDKKEEGGQGSIGSTLHGKKKVLVSLGKPFPEESVSNLIRDNFPPLYGFFVLLAEEEGEYIDRLGQSITSMISYMQRCLMLLNFITVLGSEGGEFGAMTMAAIHFFVMDYNAKQGYQIEIEQAIKIVEFGEKGLEKSKKSEKSVKQVSSPRSGLEAHRDGLEKHKMDDHDTQTSFQMLCSDGRLTPRMVMEIHKRVLRIRELLNERGLIENLEKHGDRLPLSDQELRKISLTLKEFQKSCSLFPDGKAGNITVDALYRVLYGHKDAQGITSGTAREITGSAKSIFHSLQKGSK